MIRDPSSFLVVITFRFLASLIVANFGLHSIGSDVTKFRLISLEDRPLPRFFKINKMSLNQLYMTFILSLHQPFEKTLYCDVSRLILESLT